MRNLEPKQSSPPNRAAVRQHSSDDPPEHTRGRAKVLWALKDHKHHHTPEIGNPKRETPFGVHRKPLQYSSPVQFRGRKKRQKTKQWCGLEPFNPPHPPAMGGKKARERRANRVSTFRGLVIMVFLRWRRNLSLFRGREPLMLIPSHRTTQTFSPRRSCKQNPPAKKCLEIR